MTDIKQFEEEYVKKQSESLDAAIELALARQGIDPAKVSKKDFDQLRRYNRQLAALGEKRQVAINKVHQDINTEYNETVFELNKIVFKIKQDQGLLQPPPPGQGEGAPEGASREIAGKGLVPQSGV